MSKPKAPKRKPRPESKPLTHNQLGKGIARLIQGRIASGEAVPMALALAAGNVLGKR